MVQSEQRAEAALETEVQILTYPTLRPQPASRQLVDVFRGYNHNPRISDGEFYDMGNLSSEAYPLLAPRRARGTLLDFPCRGVVSKTELCYVSGESIFVGDMEFNIGLTEGEKTLVSMGAYVIILPDKKYVNTQSYTDYGDIEASFTTSGNVTYTLCKPDGDPYSVSYTQSAAPSNPADGQYWIDTSSTPHALKQYSLATGMWASVATTYIKISATGIGSSFSALDGVSLSGSVIDELNADILIYDCADDYIITVGILDAVTTQTGALTVKRSMPVMDFVIESGNRLWGCRFGGAADGATVNEIYASKLGDFKNWSCYQGISTDSYRASVGTDGAFTGAVTHMGYPIFFKESCMHKIYGNAPSSYQIQTTDCRGVQQGCGKSLAIVNEVLYYKSRSGVCAYDGSLPVEVSQALGDESYSGAAAGAFKNKYYISMADSGGDYQLFVYDTQKRMWHREDSTRALCFCTHENEMYYIDGTDGRLRTVFGGGTSDTEPIRWYAETGTMGLETPERKYVARLNIRLTLDIGSSAFFYIQYDSMGAWEHIASAQGGKLRTIDISVRPRRCDHFRIRLEGEGGFKLYSICKSLTGGSDI